MYIYMYDLIQQNNKLRQEMMLWSCLPTTVTCYIMPVHARYIIALKEYNKYI